MSMIIRFLFSDFLDRKLQAISLLNSFLKNCYHEFSSITFAEACTWVKENKILPHIYNEKSHSELITKSSDFLKLYLKSNPDPSQL